MNFDYKSISYAQKLSDLQNYYQTSVAFSQALGITRMTLIAWNDNPQKAILPLVKKFFTNFGGFCVIPSIS
jgi:hypothetical protein